MTTKTTIETLKPFVKEAILRGDFLLSINKFSNVWIYLRLLNVEEARDLICDTLVRFWTQYLDKHEGDFVLIALEHVEPAAEDERSTSEGEIATADIAEKAVRLVDHPRLSFQQIVIDPSSFELFMAEIPIERVGIIFVALSLHIDLLRETIEKLREFGCTVRGVLTILEREKVSGPQIRDELQAELIPIIVYEEEGNNLYAVTEIEEEPYKRYHSYFV